MYFVGLHFLYAMSSATLVGVGRDAEYVAKAIEQRIQKRARDGARVRSALSSRTAAAGELMAS
jgi:hypothetical protein